MSDELHSALQHGDFMVVKDHVESPGFEINMDIGGGLTCLHVAANQGQMRIVEYLVERRANINMPDNDGVTPLLLAIWKGYASCVNYFLNHGGDLDGTSPDGDPYVECIEDDEVQKVVGDY